MWTKSYGISSREEGHSVQQSSDGGFIIAGMNNSVDITNSADDIYVVKTDLNDDTLWTRNYGESEDDWAKDIQQTSDGDYIISAYS